MAYKRKKVDRFLLDWERDTLVSDGQKLLKEIKQLAEVAERCLSGDNPAYPIWTRDLLEKAAALHQLGGCHAVLSNILVKR